MVKLISPETYSCYRGRVDFLVALMGRQSPLVLSPQEKMYAFFIVDQGEDGEIYGGAVLQQRHVSELPPLVKERISLLQPHKQFIWNMTLWRSDQAVGGDAFYGSCLKKLRKFADDQGQSFLTISLASEQLVRTKQEGWPYLFALSQDTQALSYGIISLQKDSKNSGKISRENPLLKKSIAA